ncbi:hypothetical protein Barb6_02565 [Bacteroidales bacterium Barb6]|nr:hypothetical protein Barb6_02565 [Bacteroidales bacterium Barb6]
MTPSARTLLFNLAALLLLTGAALRITQWTYAPCLFAAGAVGIAFCRLTSRPAKDAGFRIRRLHRFDIIASLLMITSAACMFSNRKEWVICLTIAAVFQLYTAFVHPKA